MKYVNDVRKSSHDPRTANARGYQGTTEQALEQIRAEELTENDAGTAREQLLKFLRVAPEPVKMVNVYFNLQQKLDDLHTEIDRVALENHIDAVAS